MASNTNTNTQQKAGSSSNVFTYLDPNSIENNFTKQKKLGTGGDGIVMLYKHKISKTSIAIKFPRVDKEKGNIENAVEDLDRRQRELTKEVSVMHTLGKHSTIVQILGWDNAWKPHAPAIFYEYCPLGDVVAYSKNLACSLGFIPEHTLWKLFTDMAKALNFIHNCQEISILHCDIKPDNILVTDGPLLRFDNKITSLPTFKLADFSRSKEYRPQFARYEDGSKCYWGTWSYAPPWEEQYHYQTPAADIWSLGATLQFFATGKDPVMTTAEFIQYMTAEGLFNENLMPTIKELEEGPPMEWFEHWPVVYRPLMDAGYSLELNKWYSMCLVKDLSRRITSKDLVKWFVPMAERQIKVLVAKYEVYPNPNVRPPPVPVITQVQQRFSFD